MVRHKETNEVVAIKRIRPASKEDRRNILNEIALMATSEHPNIIKYIETYEYKKSIYMVVEIMKCSLTEFISKTKDYIPECFISYIAANVL